MNKSKYMANSELTADVQPSNQRDRDDWKEDCRSIHRMLDRSSAPRTRRDIEFEQMLSSNATLKRLDDLMDSGDVRRRKDGPDGRMVYYEPTRAWHVSWGGGWGANIGLVNTL